MSLSRAAGLGCVLIAGCGGASPPASANRGEAGPARAFEVTSPAELVREVSSEYSEVRLAVSPDGNTMLWGSKDRPGGPGSYDLWMITRTGENWSAPAPVGFNTADKDYDPAYSPDGRHVYFFSNRPGGAGGEDIYRVAVTPDGFGAAEHLGTEVNSAGNEWAPVAMRDGSLLLSSDGRGGAGRQDLFIAAARGDGFAAAVPVPGAINTAADEFDATELADGSLVFSRSTDLAKDPVLLVFAQRGPNGFDAGTTLPTTVNVDGDATYAPSIDWRDPDILYFTATRPEATLGKRDIYRVRYRLR
jgi:TolB protein